MTFYYRIRSPQTHKREVENTFLPFIKTETSINILSSLAYIYSYIVKISLKTLNVNCILNSYYY